MKTYRTIILLIMFTAPVLRAQVRVNDPGQVVERNVEYRTNSKIDQGINKGLDKVEEGVMSIFKKKDKSKPASTNSQTDRPNETRTDNSTNTSPENTPSRTGTGSNPATNASPGTDETGSKSQATLKSYGKFDFVPGEKVVAVEDFMQDAVGDFPDKWNSTGSGEIMTIEGKTGHWLMLNKKGEYLPEYIKSLPENFTLQFDLASNESFSYLSSYLWINLVGESQSTGPNTTAEGKANNRRVEFVKL